MSINCIRERGVDFYEIDIVTVVCRCAIDLPNVCPSIVTGNATPSTDFTSANFINGTIAAQQTLFGQFSLYFDLIEIAIERHMFVTCQLLYFLLLRRS